MRHLKWFVNKKFLAKTQFSLVTLKYDAGHIM
jgi:hypothetical protein